jgi:hypothetical protein
MTKPPRWPLHGSFALRGGFRSNSFSGDLLRVHGTASHDKGRFQQRSLHKTKQLRWTLHGRNAATQAGSSPMIYSMFTEEFL